ncbi:MAG: DUF1127 domain-containing protein [Pseudomonadota bacterium]
MMIDILTAPIRSMFQPRVRVAPGTSQGLGKRIVKWLSIMNERRRLATLDERMLRDIGVAPEQVSAEVERPFWDVTSRR